MYIPFSPEEVDELVYACREATIRFQRAKTELRRGNESYQHWDVDYLNEQISHFASLEGTLAARYEAYTGTSWDSPSV